MREQQPIPPAGTELEASGASGRERHERTQPSRKGSKLWMTLAILQALVLGWLLREPLIAWFTLRPSTNEAHPKETGRPAEEPQSGSAAPPMLVPEAVVTVSAEPYPEPALLALRTGLLAYEDIRALLAGDELEGLAAKSRSLGEEFDAAATALGEPDGPMVRALSLAREAAAGLERATDMKQARGLFNQLSQYVILVAAADPRLTEGRHVFSCPMAPKPGKWLQASEKLENPYMGKAMLGCGSASTWEIELGEPGGSQATRAATATTQPAFAMTPPVHEDLEAPDPAEQHVHGQAEGIAYYTCSMHPSVKKSDPGTCPICSMDLVPVTHEELQTGVIRVDAKRRQTIGVRTEAVITRTLSRTIRAAGKVVSDETRLKDVTLKFGGYIGDLKVDTTGQQVQRGQVLFTLYSPELYTAQQEYLLALRSQATARQSGAPDRVDYLVRASEKRLKLWDVTDAQIRSLAKSGQALEEFPILSPASGYVVEKDVVAGASVQAGQRLYRIADLTHVWIEAEVSESDLPLVKVGQAARVKLSYIPDMDFEGKVSFVYPYLDSSTRTGKIRLELENPKDESAALRLRPGMYASVEFTMELGEHVVVPESAVIYAGKRKLVFVDLGEDRIQPREVKLGQKSEDHYVVESGLEPGEQVVSSANFLIAAESRLKSATEQW